jgi:hypothetical protein
VGDSQARQRMLRLADHHHGVLGQALHGKVFHLLHLAEFDHDEVDIAGARAVGQFLPGGEDGFQAQARMRAVELADGRPHQRRAAIGPDADAQFTQFQPLRERNVALQVAGDGVEQAGMREQQLPHVGRHDGAAVALQHRSADSRLQGLNAARQGGLRQVHGFGGAAEAAVFDHGDQMAQLAQLHA